MDQGHSDLTQWLVGRDHEARLRSVEDRVAGMSDRMTQLSRRVDRANARIREIEARVARGTEVLKWIGFAALMLAGAWEKLPEPLRQRLLGS